MTQLVALMCSMAVMYGRKYANADSTNTGLKRFSTPQQMNSSSFVEKWVAGSVTCSNAGMGSDPLPGVEKYCMCFRGISIHYEYCLGGARFHEFRILPCVPSILH